MPRTRPTVRHEARGAASIAAAIRLSVSFQIADHHAAGGNTAYVYEFDYAPAEDPYALGATHCAELPFLFNTFDVFLDSPVLAGAGDAQRALGRVFAAAVAEFITTGTTSDCLPYAPATGARIRHFG